MKITLNPILLLSALLCTACFLLVKASANDKPNVLLIVTDDQGYGDLRFHGNPLIDTPVLDQLAKQSTRFEHFMVSPLCSMTRASLLTGRYNLRTGCGSVTRGLETVRPNEVLIPEVLKRAGYATGMFGKWHIGEHYPSYPNGQGFDEFLGMPQGHWDNYFDPQLEHNGKVVQTKGYISDVFTEAAMKFIRAHKDGPFFCYLPFNAPHTPIQVADKYFDKYKGRGIADNKVAGIYGMVQNIDENLGRLFKLLDELQIADDTVVIYMSDNGAEGAEGSRFNAGMRGMKGSVHEGGMRVPCFVRWPGKIAADRNIKQLAAHLDMLPTIAELCGVDLAKANTKPLDGHSLAPLLLGKAEDGPIERKVFSRAIRWWALKGVKEPVVASIDMPYPGAVRTQRWRAVNEGQGWQLFDMEADPGQKKDVAAAHAKVAKNLAKAYDDWFVDVRKVPVVRPVIDVGHPEWPETKLTVPEAHLGEGLRWYNKWGFAHDWITDWQKPGQKIWWRTRVVTGGRYRVSLRYACAEDMVGSQLKVSASGASVTGVIKAAHPPHPVQRPTRIKKPRFVETFIVRELGEINLKAGETKVAVELVNPGGESTIDLHTLILERMD